MTLDKLLSGSIGQGCSFSAPQEQSWNGVLRQLGTMYVGGASEALKEYISNGADATKDQPERKITVQLQRRKNKLARVLIIDNGNGMKLPQDEQYLIGKTSMDIGADKIAPDSILRLPKSVGDSAKFDDPSTQGNKAVGALSWQSIGNRVAFISHQKGSAPVAWACQYNTDATGRHNYQAKISVGPDVDVAVLKGQYGTAVVIDQIDEN